MPQLDGQVNRLIVTPPTEGGESNIRLGRYSEQYQTPVGTGLYGLCQQGRYFKAVNPVIGTGIIIGSHVTTLLETNAFLNIRNVSNYHMVMDYIRLTCTVAGASQTLLTAVMALDTQIRYSSGGTQLVNVNSNMDIGASSQAVIWFGALTTTAATVTERYHSRFTLRANNTPVSDQYIVSFGRTMLVDTYDLGSANTELIYTDVGPAILGPGSNQNLTIFGINAATVTQPTFEIEIAWWEV